MPRSSAKLQPTRLTPSVGHMGGSKQSSLAFHAHDTWRSWHLVGQHTFSCTRALPANLIALPPTPCRGDRGGAVGVVPMHAAGRRLVWQGRRHGSGSPRPGLTLPCLLVALLLPALAPMGPGEARPVAAATEPAAGVAGGGEGARLYFPHLDVPLKIFV